ncbi:MAG: U32 family peptidase [Bacteroidales bacterium]|nr:U32 family peptidase [Bacteroidales bacterium]
MQALELLAPARNKDIGIAAIDCGADAVYIAGPDFGARKAAGNSFEDIAELCAYAHRFGVRIFVTFNTLWQEGEEEEAHAQLLRAQAARADAFIIREPRIAAWKDITVPLHASTQCAIRDVERARYFESLGCSRIILERELSLEQIREIGAAVRCELEFFVHGALCVGYSGECRLSEYLDGRSADRGECIQACRSLYDLVDGDGRVLLRKKAVLSLKDFNLKARLEDLADAGVCSFKIEGRLKNASYVKNVVRDYSLALDALVAKYPDSYCRASFGEVTGGFVPDTAKTFNRGYTELFLDGKRSRWSSMDAPKSMGEEIGTVLRIRRSPGQAMQFSVKPLRRDLVLRNGDGFAITTADGVTGFRGDVCDGLQVHCKDVPDLREGMTLYRNINAAFEKSLEAQACRREIPVRLSVRVHGRYVLELHAVTQDGREVLSPFHTDVETAENRERAEAMLREQLGKRSGCYRFSVEELSVETAGGKLPLLSAATINSMRRLVAEDLDSLPREKKSRVDPGMTGEAVAGPLASSAVPPVSPAVPLVSSAGPQVSSAGLTGGSSRELMRSKYCVRYELGLCPKYQGAKPPKDLFLLNNGRRLALHFDCAACEMSVTPDRK